MAASRDDKPLLGLGEVLRLSAPASLTMLNSTLMRFVDGRMVAVYSPSAMAAQFCSGILSFVPESFMTGMLVVVNTYVSQNLGVGRRRYCGLYAWAGLALAGICSILVIPAAWLAEPIFQLIGHGPEAQGMEAMYFTYMILGIPLTLTARSFAQFFYGIHRPGIVLATSLASNAFNVGANYVLIFGKLGFPEMGIEGAAIATAISSFIPGIILTVAAYTGKTAREYRTRENFRFSGALTGRIIRFGFPSSTTSLI